MPILWKHLLKGYLQLFLLTVSAFVAILLVVRFQEIALFASSGARLHEILLFSLYQIPYILPIAIPISSLLGSMILFQKMSIYQEVTALRASGLSLTTLCYPLLLAASLLSVINFTLTSEMAPLTRTLAKNLLYQIGGNNPLIVMQKDSALSLKSFEFDLKNLETGKKAEEVICITRQDSQDRIGLFTARELSIDDNSLYGKDLSLLSSVDPKFSSFDHLILENQKQMQINKKAISAHLFNTDWFAKDDLLTLKEVLDKHRKESGSWTSKTGIDLVRRACIGFCPFTFTLIGIAFGINIHRQKRKKAFWAASFLATLLLGSFLASKSLSKLPLITLALYILPHPFSVWISLRSLQKISRGTLLC